MKTITALALLIAVLSSFANAANKSNLKFTFFQYPGNLPTSPLGISNKNVIVGFYTDLAGKQHGFILNNGTYATLDNPNGTSTTLYGINSSGVIVGTYFANNMNRWEAFSYENGVFTIIGPSDCINAYAYTINDNGEIGGSCETATSYNGWILSRGTYQTVSVPGSLFTSVYGINDNGLAVVTWEQQGKSEVQSSLFDGTNFTTIDVPGAVDSYANGINAAGYVAYSYLLPGSAHAAVLSGSTYHEFNGPGCGITYTTANGINDYHEIVGSCTKERAQYGYLLRY